MPTEGKILTISYINTDLDLESPLDLAPLVAAFEEKGFFTAHIRHDADGLWYASFECLDDGDNHAYTPEKTISVLMDVIDSLGDEERRLWLTCATRVLDIGYECGDNPQRLVNDITNCTLSRIVAANALLRITLYRSSEPERK
jgi:hypothetical protein